MLEEQNSTSISFTKLILDEDTLTRLEVIRLICGLSKVQMLAALHERPGNTRLFATPTRLVSTSTLEKAERLRSDYYSWATSLELAIVAGTVDGGVLSATALAKIFDINIMYLYKLAERGVAVPSTYNHSGEISRVYSFNRDDALTSLSTALSWLAVDPGSRVRGPLSESFMRYIGREESD